MRDDVRLTEAHQLPIAEVADRLGIGGLRRAGGELVGPCPVCGGADRFGINLARNVFVCRKDCGPHARGDQIALVQHVRGVDFPAALDWLVGPREELSVEERRRLEARAAANRQRRAADEARMRAQAIEVARTIWQQTQPAEGTPVEGYLEVRGIDPFRLGRIPPCLRYMADCPYTVADEERRGRWRVVHRGPAMVAGVVDAANVLTAVHRTWLDLSSPTGKAAVVDPAARRTDLPAKKVLGRKKGGAIRLRSARGATTLYMGEGIETTLSALAAAGTESHAAFWAGVDLGNMAGRRRLGQGMTYAGVPDLQDDEAFVPPVQIRHLVYIQDGDSDPRLTRAKLESGLRRAMVLRPGLTGAIVHPGEGRDLNDILRNN